LSDGRRSKAVHERSKDSNALAALAVCHPGSDANVTRVSVSGRGIIGRSQNHKINPAAATRSAAEKTAARRRLLVVSPVSWRLS
jgi:hypothetical protein